MLLAGCRSLFVVGTGDGEQAGGRPGQVHSAVLEYILMSPDVPVGRFFEFALARDKDMGELDGVRTAANALAGGQQPAPEHYHRASVAQMIEAIQDVLAGRNDGTARLFCCTSIDPFAKEFGKENSGVASGAGSRIIFDFIVNRDARFIRVDWHDQFVSRELSWDLSRVPNAFDVDAELSAGIVAETIVPLHPEQRWYD
jgi:hypothetical protein